MLHTEVYACFREAMSMFAFEDIKEWFPNGKNSIRIKLSHGDEYVFTVPNPDYKGEWIFETLDSFIRNTLEGAGK